MFGFRSKPIHPWIRCLSDSLMEPLEKRFRVCRVVRTAVDEAKRRRAVAPAPGLRKEPSQNPRNRTTAPHDQKKAAATVLRAVAVIKRNPSRVGPDRDVPVGNAPDQGVRRSPVRAVTLSDRGRATREDGVVAVTRDNAPQKTMPRHELRHRLDPKRGHAAENQQARKVALAERIDRIPVSGSPRVDVLGRIVVEKTAAIVGVPRMPQGGHLGRRKQK